MIKNNKVTLVLSSIAILLPALVGIILWDKLPDSMAIHWNAAGESDGFGTKAFSVFGMPFIMLAFHWLCVIVTEKDPKNKNQSPKMKKLVLWICPVLTWFVYGIIYFSALSKDMNPVSVLPFLLGLMFIVLGNYLPKCKQNYTIGIKIKWTLENEINWNKTHRFSGILWFIGGLAIIASGFLPDKFMLGVMSAVILICVIAPVVYSYSVFSKMK